MRKGGGSFGVFLEGGVFEPTRKISCNYLNWVVGGRSMMMRRNHHFGRGGFILDLIIFFIANYLLFHVRRMTDFCCCFPIFSRKGVGCCCFSFHSIKFNLIE